MSTPSTFVVTISRQLGAGGAVVGKQLAEKLGVFFADRDILRNAALQLSAVEEDLEHREERLLSFWHSLFKTLPQNDVITIPPVARALEYSDQELYDIESHIIQDIASRNSSVILGRCGHYVLRDEPRHIRIFLHADKEFRIGRVMELYDMTHQEALEMVERTDKQRAAYCKTFTGIDWKNADNYDLAIDTSKIGPDVAVKFILDYMKLRPEFN